MLSEIVNIIITWIWDYNNGNKLRYLVSLNWVLEFGSECTTKGPISKV